VEKEEEMYVVEREELRAALLSSKPRLGRDDPRTSSLGGGCKYKALDLGPTGFWSTICCSLHGRGGDFFK